MSFISFVVPYLTVVRRFVCTKDLESYAGGSVATGRAFRAGQVKEPSKLGVLWEVGSFPRKKKKRKFC
jgi:hypothetical protein